MCVERFSIESRNAKTEVITLANHKKTQNRIEPVKTYMGRRWVKMTFLFPSLARFFYLPPDQTKRQEQAISESTKRHIYLFYVS